MIHMLCILLHLAHYTAYVCCLYRQCVFPAESVCKQNRFFDIAKTDFACAESEFHPILLQNQKISDFACKNGIFDRLCMKTPEKNRLSKRRFPRGKKIRANRVTRANQKISPKISPKATLRKPGSSRCQSSGWRMERSASGAGFEKGARTFICACFLFFPFGVGVRVCVYFALFWWWLIDVDVRLFRSLRVHAGTAIRIRMTKTKR